MRVLFVHGWGVREPDYGSLPQELGADEIWLSRYISYSDAVTMDDLAHAFERARLAEFPGESFACVTHSTGGPVMRTWLDRYRGPLTALVMLAPPNHGSALARLGKSRLSRMKSWMEGVEPGQRILDWLELGSDESWDLNKRWLDLNWPGRSLVVTGATPDRSLYDHLNSYTGEPGSDGVVRVAAANLNYTWMRLKQRGGTLEIDAERRSPYTPTLVLPGSSHHGILSLAGNSHGCDAAAMLIMKVRDSAGEPVHDYDFLLTAGPECSPDALPKGFFLDRQRNRNALTYFLNHSALATAGPLGLVVQARPEQGPVHYRRAEFRADILLHPHETTMLEVILERHRLPALYQLSAYRG